MTRVLLLVKGLGRGGAETIVATTARHLDRDRFQVEVAYLEPSKNAFEADIREAGVRVHCLGESRGVSWMRRLRQVVLRGGFDVVHVHSPHPAIWARFALRGRTRVVYTEHNVWSRYRPATYLGNMLSFACNDHVFAVSDEVRRSIRYPKALSFLRIPPVETLYHGLDPSYLATASSAPGEIREQLKISPYVPVVGCVANFKAHKGHRYLVTAAALVLEKQPETRFVLVGVGPLETEVKQMVERMHLQHAFVFTGFRKDTLRVASCFDVFVLPSLREGLPLALLEGMALGRPVVATRVGGIPEVIDDGTDGMVIDPADAHALASAILRLIEDRPLAEQLGTAARAKATHFDIRNTVTRMEEVYRELVGHQTV